MNTNFKVIGLTRLGIKPKSTAAETDVLATRPSELLIKLAFRKGSIKDVEKGTYLRKESIFLKQIPHHAIENFFLFIIIRIFEILQQF